MPNPNSDNISRYCDPRFERLVADQAVTANARSRENDFAELQRRIHDDLPVVPLYYLAYFEGMNAQVHGFARNMLQYPVAPERWDKY